MFAVLLGLLGAPSVSPADNSHANLPHVVLITVDTLRADRLSIYGNPAPTSPNIDALLANGARFNAARTVEPLTAPASASMLTSLYPHEHGTSRNGIPMREGLRSLPGMLMELGYATAGFVSNWTLTDKQSGLAEHFDVYQEVLTKKRWFIWFGESDAEDVRLQTEEWFEEDGVYPGQPLFLWVHFVDPHAPYKLHESFAPELGVPTDGSASVMQRYDTEIAYVDHQIGLMLDNLGAYLDMDNTLVVFASDHGEGLGEHGYKGHGRYLYEEELRIPLGFTWNGRITQEQFQAPASLIDIAPTVMGLLGAPIPPEWRGFDWSAALRSGQDGPMDRITYFQAHKGAVKGGTQKSDVAARKRINGLLRLGTLQGREKQVLDLEEKQLERFTLPAEPPNGPMRYSGTEQNPVISELPGNAPPALLDWQSLVEQELTERDRSPPPPLDEEAVERLKSLGYIN